MRFAQKFKIAVLSQIAIVALITFAEYGLVPTSTLVAQVLCFTFMLFLAMFFVMAYVLTFGTGDKT